MPAAAMEQDSLIKYLESGLSPADMIAQLGLTSSEDLNQLFHQTLTRLLARNRQDLGLSGYGMDTVDRTPWASLTGGPTFHHLPMQPQDWLNADLASGKMSRRSLSYVMRGVLEVIRDIRRRYLYQDRGKPQHGNCSLPAGGVAVELGAYLGFYAMYLARLVGTGGRVLAVEMEPRNHRIMQKNFARNFPGTAQAVHMGVSARPGTATAYFGQGQINSMRREVVTRVRDAPRQVTVPTDSVDNILDQAGIDRVDLMIIQINGTELEALEGMTQSLSRVENFAIAAPYGRDGQSNKEPVARFLAGHGFEVSVENFVYARRARRVRPTPAWQAAQPEIVAG